MSETFEETLAHAVAVVMREQLAPLQQRVKALETENIALRAEFRLVKELALNYRDEPSRPMKTTGPFGPAPRIGRSGKNAH